MKLRVIIFVFLFFSSVGILRSQEVYGLGVSHQQGLNLKIPAAQSFGSSSPFGVEVNFHKQKRGNDYWEKQFNYPQTGWSLSLIDHKNQFLGSTLALNRYINYIFLRNKGLELYLKLSQGIMYATRTYVAGGHENENYNDAFGQKINFSQEIGLGINLYPTNKWFLNLGATAIHFSNGAMSQPNDGLNSLMFKLGVGYVIGDKAKMEFIEPDAEEDDRTIKYNIYLGAGFKQIDIVNEEKYNLFTMAFYADKKISRINALNAGVDIYMNRAVEHQIGNDPEHKGKDFKRIGISAGHELFIGKVGILTQLGYHVYSPYPAFSDFYQKFGFKYYVSDLFYLTFTGRIFNLEISDEVSFGIGVRL